MEKNRAHAARCIRGRYKQAALISGASMFVASSYEGMKPQQVLPSGIRIMKMEKTLVRSKKSARRNVENHGVSPGVAS